ncbi:MAG: hypothetical protein ACOYJD_06430 [Christensenellales bacterium]|jgi:hypothetical protein
MENIKKMLPYLAVVVLAFYLLPLLIKDTGSAMLMLLNVVPIIVFVCAVVYGIINSFNPIYAIAVMLLFVPTIFIFYNMTAWVYALGYGIISFAGNAIGILFRKNGKQNDA